LNSPPSLNNSTLPLLRHSQSTTPKKDFLHRFVHEDVSKVYNIGKEIGYGKYGVVRLVAKKSYEKKRFALKSIPRDKLNADIQQLEKEFEILRQVDHPNIINFYEMYVDDNYCHLVTEFCGGGELFEHIIARGKFSESYASKIIKQILSAIKHLQDRGICHRDLKPENILFESKSKDASIRLIDFGLAKYYNTQESKQVLQSPAHLMRTRIGTPYYMAPEVLDGAYDESCDMWSIGVITYCLLCGYPPFNAETD
jgi:calcium-dependent protein kinase